MTDKQIETIEGIEYLKCNTDLICSGEVSFTSGKIYPVIRKGKSDKTLINNFSREHICNTDGWLTHFTIMPKTYKPIKILKH